MISNRIHSSKVQAKLFDGYTKKFFLNSEENFSSSFEFTQIMRFISFKKNKKNEFLDLGCGNGRFGLRLAKTVGKFNNVVGLDFSKEAVKLANISAKENKIKNFRAVCCDFKNFSAPNRFDYVITINMLHHSEDISDTISRIYKCLKPGGFWINIENNPFNLSFFIFFVFIKQLKAHLTINYFLSNCFYHKRVAKKVGFKYIKHEKYGFLPTSLYNFSKFFLFLNKYLNIIPILNFFCAFYFLKFRK
jgi:ubiquinone/menaquinone biosynthesis C-methylase UbiE